MVSEAVAAHRAVLFPWDDVHQHHRWAYPAQMLALEARRRAGEVLPDELAVRLDRWLERLDDAAQVVAYDRSTPEGWSYVGRRFGDGTGLVRRPGRLSRDLGPPTRDPGPA